MRALLAGLVALAPTAALADSNDFVLHRFKSCGDGAFANCSNGIIWAQPYDLGSNDPNRLVGVSPDEDAFRSFVADLGPVVAGQGHPSAAPDGLEFSAVYSVTPIPSSESHWASAMPEEGASPPSSLATLGAQALAGVGWGFALGLAVRGLEESSLTVFQGEAAWGHEPAPWWLPGPAARLWLARAFGNRDLDLTAGGLDLGLHKSGPVTADVRLAVHAGVSLGVVTGSSSVLDATPGIDPFPPPHCDTDPESASRGQDSDGRVTEECVRALEGRNTGDLRANFVLPEQSVKVNRGVFGVRADWRSLWAGVDAHVGERTTLSLTLGLKL